MIKSEVELAWLHAQSHIFPLCSTPNMPPIKGVSLTNFFDVFFEIKYCLCKPSTQLRHTFAHPPLHNMQFVFSKSLATLLFASSLPFFHSTRLAGFPIAVLDRRPAPGVCHMRGVPPRHRVAASARSPGAGPPSHWRPPGPRRGGPLFHGPRTGDSWAQTLQSSSCVFPRPFFWRTG